MIHILILIALGLATYLFHNYQAFNEAYIRPWAIEQVDFNREADPQALCDLLDPDVKAIINDKYTRYSYDFSGGKEKTCEYFKESAKNFQKPRREANGYIFDRLSTFDINHEDLFKDYAEVSFSTKTVFPALALKASQNGESLIGTTHVKLTVKTPIFKDPKITHYEFTRKLVQAQNSN